MSGTAKEPKATEEELLHLLERRHAKTGNGGAGEYAYMTHVRNDGGFSATRTFDAVTVSLWPSRGFEIHVYEVKVSRSDWMRELKDPAKSEAAWVMGDRFSIVATAGVVDPNELPEGWGLIEAHGGKVNDAGVLTGRRLRPVRQAAFHGPSERAAQRVIPRGLLVAMLRRAGAIPDVQTAEDREREALRTEIRKELEATFRSQIDSANESRRETADAIRRFTNLSGVQILPGYGATTQDDVDEKAREIRAALADATHQERVRSRLLTMRHTLAEQLAYLDRVIENPEQDHLRRVQ